MRELLYEPVAQLLGTLFYLGLAAALTLVGALAEQAGIQNLTAGHSTIGVWEAAMGALLLYAALNVVSDVVLPRLRDAA